MSWTRADMPGTVGGDTSRRPDVPMVVDAGGTRCEIRLAAGAGIKPGKDEKGPFWSVHASGKRGLLARFHVESCDLPAGWYQWSVRVACLGGQLSLPTVFFGPHEEHHMILPAPDHDGLLQVMLLFTDPVASFGFAASMEPVMFRLHDMRLCRLTKSQALRYMLGGAGVSLPAQGVRLIELAMRTAQTGLSQAVTGLYSRYVQDLREQALQDGRAHAISDISPAPVSAGANTVAENDALDAALVPYLLDPVADDAEFDVAADTYRIEREVRLLAESDLFDARYYLDNNRDVARMRIDPLRHFCQHGWRTLRNPSPDFDVWWYWANHLDPARERINPLVHYALRGKQDGLSAHPPRVPRLNAGHAFPASAKPRRACLFAGYDADGLIDQVVVDYVRELSRHADVYYLCDGDLRPGELEKLSACTHGAWAIRHGAYDFGSYAMLAGELVGWDTIESYDELLFVNDSAWLLRPLDDVFRRMQGRACDWWGLQATKGLASTRHKRSNHFDRPIPMDRVRDELLVEYETEYIYDFLVGSYFLAFRAPVIHDPGFRKLVNGVVRQSRKVDIIRKYEVGITRHLIGYGHAFDTYIDSLYPFHPVYTDTAFELVRKGFPLFKRYFLAENHYRVPGLHDWKQRLRRLVPDAPLDSMERNLLRTCDYERLHDNLHIEKRRFGRTYPAGLLQEKAFAKADAACPKHDDWWAFPACAFTHTFSGNERAVFEAVKNDASIRKIVLARSKQLAVDGENVDVFPLRSREGQSALMHARQAFIKHTPTRNLVYPVNPSLHNLINLWHGIPLKRIGYASLDMQHQLDAIGREHARCRAVISSSKIDAMAMTSAFYPLTYNDIWVTGLPRHDFIVRDFDALPEDLRAESRLLEALLEGRHLVLFAPTFRHATQDGCYCFSLAERERLRQWLGRNDAVLGVREHMADHTCAYTEMLADIGAINLGSRWFPNVEVLYRRAGLLMTDYSSSFVDFMLTGRPMISFAYDYDHYMNRERGLFYDMELVFPGPVCKSFPALMDALEEVSGYVSTESVDEAYTWKRRLFFDHMDDHNADRVVEKVKQLYCSGDTKSRGEERK